MWIDFGEYNKKIKNKGKKHYARLLVLTTILETLALSFLPSIIDNKWENFWLKFFIMLIFFSLINTYRYTRFTKL